MAKTDLTAQRLRELLHYDPETGKFAWKAHIRGAVHGKDVGHVTQFGYRVVMLDKKNHFAHRLAWLYVSGEWPKEFIDHINGSRDDNRIANLRPANKMENGQNQRKAKAGSQSNVLGAWKHGKAGWRSSITVNKVIVRLGTFPSPEEAHAAYLDAKRKLHPMCTI